MKQDVIILSSKEFEFVNQETGEVISGTKISYINPCDSQVEGIRGYAPIQTNIDTAEAREFLKELPGSYVLDMVMLPGKNNSIAMKIVRATFKEKVDFSKCLSK